MDNFRRHFNKAERHTLRSAFLGAGTQTTAQKIGEGNSCSRLLSSLAKELAFVPVLLIYCEHGVNHGLNVLF